MKLKKTCIYLSAIILLVLINTVALKAQSPGTPCGDPDLDCPIDTPVILLVAAVLFLTVKKMTDAKQKLKNSR
ncbi:hypothetical protein [Mucilaginibacter arboris]|uniref:Uncharacterized protein n=1 Tax=Mucilaginibacter arboris TaxID=2682090 RepID=A0A7K1SWW9_9SPHI|nr:hypothetical protein [Mucilaginibacter arboris]MVN21821.1 hypothetical protein [Mucilaginibacter arboris]